MVELGQEDEDVDSEYVFHFFVNNKKVDDK
jgi:hypothetical protein